MEISGDKYEKVVLVDEKTNEVIAKITDEEIDLKEGYQIRLTPKNSGELRL